MNFMSWSNSQTWRGRDLGGLNGSPPAKGVLTREKVVVVEDSSSRAGGHAAQLCWVEVHLPGARAGTREVEGVLLAVNGIPGTCGWIGDSRHVMVSGEVIRRHHVLTVDRQRLRRESGRLGVRVHAGDQQPLSGKPLKPPGPFSVFILSNFNVSCFTHHSDATNSCAHTQRHTMAGYLSSKYTPL